MSVPAALVAPVANAAANAATQESTDSVQARQAPSGTGEGQKGIVEGIPERLSLAIQGTKEGAKYYTDVVTPELAGELKSGKTVEGQDLTAATEAYTHLKAARKATLDSLKDAGDAMEAVKNAATINPNAYNEKLGISGKLVSALGMVLSGIGSGLTGQPNMAMQVFQTRMQQDIDAQKQNFQNRIEAAAQAQNMVLTNQQRETIAQHAYQMAVASVHDGIQANMSAIQAKGLSATAQANAASTNLMLFGKASDAMQNFNQTWSAEFKSADTKHLKVMGLVAKGVKDWFDGDTSSDDRLKYLRRPAPNLFPSNEPNKPSNIPQEAPVFNTNTQKIPQGE